MASNSATLSRVLPSIRSVCRLKPGIIHVCSMGLETGACKSRKKHKCSDNMKETDPDCDRQPKCGEERKPLCTTERMINPGCALGMPRKTPKNYVKPKRPFKSMWENPQCCIEIEEKPIERFDDKHYKPSNKRTRIYYRTWKKCPKIVCRRKKVCCRLPEPPLPKRKPPCINKTAQVCDQLGPCPKIRMEGCCKARIPPKCTITRKKTICQRKPNPYPSFSECNQPDIKRPHAQECKCFSIPSICDMFAELRRLDNLKKNQ